MKIEMNILINQLQMFFVLLLVGYFSVKFGLLTKELHEKLSTIIMRLIIPALLIFTMARSVDSDSMRLIIPIIGSGFLLVALLIIIGYIISKILMLKGDKAKVHIAVSTFGSLGFFGIPLATAILGPIGTMAFGIFSIVDNITIWTIGLFLSSGSNRNKSHDFKSSLIIVSKKLLNPCTVAVFIGLIILAFRISINKTIMGAIATIGNCASPLALIYIGGSIAYINIKEIYKHWPIFFIIITKMIIVPIFVYFILDKINANEVVKLSMTLIAALPSSSMFSLMAKENGNDAVEYAIYAAIITVCMSIFTIPLVVSVIS
jgi:predicted permease